MTRDEENVIIARVLGGDADAFEPLVTANQSFVYSIALKMLTSPEDAFDASQEAFVKAFRSLRSFKGESSFSSWLYRITANICLDMMRKRRRRSIISLTCAETDDDSQLHELELPDTRFAPETELERNELRRAIGRALATLPEEQRTILILRETGCMSYAEISSLLGIESGTVKSRLFRARARLAKILKEDGTF